MATHNTFAALEHQAWSVRAKGYDHYSGRFCSQGIAPLIEAAAIARGHVVLDMCCGTGSASAAAAARGAIVTGLDFSEEMVEAARAKNLAAQFQVGDAEALPFESGAFDRVINNFGTLHLPEPARAIAEAARVLKPGGRYAFSVWCGPDISPLFRIVPEVISAHGTLDVGLPPAPPMFRYADRAVSNDAMQSAGFTDITFIDVPVALEFGLDEIADFFGHAFVRTTMVLDRQTPEARARIERELRRQLAPFAVEGTVRLPLPALIVSGARA